MTQAARLYLDANATEPLRPEARAAMLDALDQANPSSVHAEGRRARSLLEESRRRIAALLGLGPGAVVFCSGATEANAMVLQAAHRRGSAILVSAIEHDSVRQALDEPGQVPVTPEGVIDLDALDQCLAAVGPGATLALLAAHNETGLVQPIEDAARIARSRGARLHCDATQMPGRLKLDAVLAHADTVSLSGHKLGGTKGSGLLLVLRGEPPAPLLRGGGQERGTRAGTENLPAHVALAAALEPALRLDEAPRLQALRDRIEQGLSLASPGSRGVGQRQPRLPNTSCIVLPGMAASTQVIALDLAGIAVSAGSACSSGKVAASASLLAMGLAEAAGQAIRVSLPWNAPPDAAERFLDAYAAVAARARR